MKQRTAAILLLALGATTAVAAGPGEKTCDELIQESEELWVKTDFAGSDPPLAAAQKICPERAEIYWRQARNLYDRTEQIPRDQKPTKTELLERYHQVEVLADQCLQRDDQDGNCWLWKAVAIGRRGSTQGVLKTLFEVDDLEAALLKALALKPAYRSMNGAASSLADVLSMLGIFYRVLPEWTCSFPFKTVIGTCGNLDQSIKYHEQAVAREPTRIEYRKELGIALICRAQVRNRPEDLDRGKQILTELQARPEFKATDKIDQEHARMILADPSLACGYSRDAQQEQSPEAYQEAIKGE